jgi:signal transduction histidine kinase
MVLFIVSACWLFRYRGLLLCVPAILVAIWLIYLYLSPYALTPGQTFEERAIVGFGTFLLLGLMTCWLRTAVDLMYEARSRALAVEQERLQVTLDYEYQYKLNELKDQFLLNVSHELRTPLSVVGGALELLQEHDKHLGAMERADVLTLALKNHEELVSLVSQVLDAAKVVSETPRVQLEAVRLQKLVQEELAALSPQDALAYTIHVQVPEEIMVWADPELLRQVLRHLLSNVFKYVPRQTEIHIQAVQETPSSPVYLSLQDAGPGIPAEELPLLFEKFVRLKRDLAGNTRGAGLGLYICKRLVEAMGGSISVESSGRVGEGSRFCVTLPPFSNAIIGEEQRGEET